MDKTIEFRGLTRKEAEESRRKHGANAFLRKKRKSFGRLFLSGLNDPIILILLAALGINIFFSFQTFHWYETLGIMLAVLVSTFVSTLSERGSERAFEKMQEENANLVCRVYRDGALTQIPAAEIVVGDVLPLGAGEIIPADGTLLRGSIHADQSALNGESGEAEKYPCRTKSGESDLSDAARVFRGSVCTGGEGVMLVKEVGKKTLYGKIAAELSADTRQSPLKLRLGHLARQISRIGYISALIIGTVSLFSSFVIANGWEIKAILTSLSRPGYVFSSLLEALALAITVIVVAVPEGLPMMITVVLSSNMKRMMRDRVLVRKLVGIETCGSINILFTDKTGTLTGGKHTVNRVLLGNGREFCSAKLFRKEKLFSLFWLSARFNTDSALTESGEITGGNATDRALFAFAAPYGKTSCRLTKKIPFDSRNKFAAAYVSGEKEHIFIKGAPDVLLPRVKKYYDENGELHPLTARRETAKKIGSLAHAGKRILLVGETNASFTEIALIAFVVISDPLRADAKKSVTAARGAGIQVVMITGDGKETAQRIAEEAGILSSLSGGVILEAEELHRMTDEQLQRILPRLAVISRALPADKSRLVRAAQQNGLVVGMTGDGVNDAPALKLADVGFAMGSGTEVAKEAGDIVILDGALSSITKAVLYGRTIFKSIRKFIVFQLTMNFIAVGISVLGALFGVETPITIMQMLWINLIMDTLGGLAFAGESPLAEYMKEAPKKRTEPIMNAYMISQIVWVSVFSVALLLFVLFLPASRRAFCFAENPTYFMTVFFSVFIFIAVLNCFNARTHRISIFSSLFRNMAFVLVILFVVTVQLLIIRFGGALFRTVPLSAYHIFCSFIIAFSVIPFDAVRKILLRIKGKPYRF